jgi:hypothetical protein
MKQHKARELRTGKSHNGLEKSYSSSDHINVRVAALAYTMYEQRGRQDGHDVEDWIQAEKKILEEIASQDTRSKARSDV